ncbi:hypothetical protein HK405_000502 [Cladochytrium tenue]|nr:hypothetical protein HK405_000502 [Cladochytrium tenue]
MMEADERAAVLGELRASRATKQPPKTQESGANDDAKLFDQLWRPSVWRRVAAVLAPRTPATPAAVRDRMEADLARGLTGSALSVDRFFLFDAAYRPRTFDVRELLYWVSQPTQTAPPPGGMALLCLAGRDGGRATMLGTPSAGFKFVAKDFGGAEVDRAEVVGGRVWKRGELNEQGRGEAAVAGDEDGEAVEQANWRHFEVLALARFGLRGFVNGDV